MSADKYPSIYFRAKCSLLAEALFLVFADGRTPGKEPLLAVLAGEYSVT